MAGLATAVFSLIVLLVIFGGGIESTSPASFLSAERVGRIDLLGPIEESEEFLEELQRHSRDPRIKALVVRIDSPGGGVAPSQEMYAGLRRFQAEEGRPVVVSVGNVAASGGYYVACASDQIVTEGGSLIGSIGVIWSFADVSGLMEKLGIRIEVVKAGRQKDVGAYWRAMTDEERAGLEATLRDVHTQFIEVVALERALEQGAVRELADGRIFSGRQAIELGLADTVGGLEEARALAARLAGISEDTPFEEKRRFEPNWFSQWSATSRWLRGAMEATPRLEYRMR